MVVPILIKCKYRAKTMFFYINGTIDTKYSSNNKRCKQPVPIYNKYKYMYVLNDETFAYQSIRKPGYRINAGSTNSKISTSNLALYVVGIRLVNLNFGGTITLNVHHV